MWFVLVVGLLLPWSAWCASQTINPGISQSSFQAIVQQLGPGDTLTFNNGTYDVVVDERLYHHNSGSPGNPITYKAANYRQAIIRPIRQADGGNANNTNPTFFWIDGQHDLVIDGFVIDNSNFAGRNSYGMVVFGASTNAIVIQNNEIMNGTDIHDENGSFGILASSGIQQNITIRGNSIHDWGWNEFCDCHGFGGGGCTVCGSYGLYASFSNSLIEGNEFYHNSRYGWHGFNSGGVPQPTTNTIVRNNIFRDNGGPGALYASGCQGCQFYNNLLYGNGQRLTDEAALQVQAAGNAAIDCTVYNNTIANNLRGAITLGNVSNSILRNNILWGNGADTIQITGSVSNNTINTNLCQGTVCSLSVDPQFVNAGAGDFHLSAASPTQVTTGGVDLSSVFTTDHDGNARSVPWSLGAYEFGAAGLPAPTNLRLISITP